MQHIITIIYLNLSDDSIRLIILFVGIIQSNPMKAKDKILAYSQRVKVISARLYCLQRHMGYGQDDRLNKMSICWDQSKKRICACLIEQKLVIQPQSGQQEQSSLKRHGREYDRKALNQMHFLLKLQHQNVVKLLQIYQNQNKAYVLLQYCEGGNLQNLIACKGKLSVSRALVFFRVLVKLAKYFEETAVCKRNISPENIMVCGEQFKMYGFEWMVNHEHLNFMDKAYQGNQYSSPQILEEREYSSKCDVWSLGAVFYFVLTGQAPFKPGCSRKTVLDFRGSSDVPLCYQILIQGMLSYEEKYRYSIAEVSSYLRLSG